MESVFCNITCVSTNVVKHCRNHGNMNLCVHFTNRHKYVARTSIDWSTQAIVVFHSMHHWCVVVGTRLAHSVDGETVSAQSSSDDPDVLESDMSGGKSSRAVLKDRESVSVWDEDKVLRKRCLAHTTTRGRSRSAAPALSSSRGKGTVSHSSFNPCSSW